MYQAITDSQFGQQNAWSGRIDLNLFAQFVDDDAQVMRVIAVRAILNLLHDLLTRHNLAGFPRENLQHQISLSDRGQVFAVNRPGADGQIADDEMFADVAAEAFICGRARRWRQLFFS